MDPARPRTGAAQLTDFVHGIKHVNSDALYAGWFHSRGTTAGAETVLIDPDLYDQLFFAGSAGLSVVAAIALNELAESGDLQLFATKAGGDWTTIGTGDWVAPIGYGEGGLYPLVKPLIGDTQHPINPLTLSGAEVVSAKFGTVHLDSGHSEVGVKIASHDAHGIELAEDTVPEVLLPGLSETQLNELSKAGYFQPGSRTYWEGIDQLADLVTNAK